MMRPARLRRGFARITIKPAKAGMFFYSIEGTCNPASFSLPDNQFLLFLEKKRTK
jgi:hypothetical protein